MKGQSNLVIAGSPRKIFRYRPREFCGGGRALLWLGGRYRLTKPWQTPNTEELEHGRQSPGANVRGQEGNNPDRQLRSRISAKWKTKWEGLDSQEVGLEAAIL